VVAVTNGRLDFGTWERIFLGQAEWLARESRRPSAEAGVGQDHRWIGVLRAILTSTDAGRYVLCDVLVRLAEASVEAPGSLVSLHDGCDLKGWLPPRVTCRC